MHRNSKAVITFVPRNVRLVAIIPPPAAVDHRSSTLPLAVTLIQSPAIHPTCPIRAGATGGALGPEGGSSGNASVDRAYTVPTGRIDPDAASRAVVSITSLSADI